MQIKLYEHQRRWMQDRSRFRVALKAREIGWSLVVCFEAIRDAVGGKTKILASRSQRQSDEMMRRVQTLLPLMLASTNVTVVKETMEQVSLSSSGRILSFPANPDTIAGFTGDIVLDEFARHLKSREIWEALFPAISSRSDLTISVLSTPMGCAGKFYELVEEARRPESPWSLHTCDIHEAVANGCKHEIDVLREACTDEETFRQAYLCEFIDEAYALLPYDTLLACVNDDLSYEPDPSALDGTGDLYLGMDISRKHDLTVIAILETRSSTLETRRYVCRGFIEMRNETFDAQAERLYGLMRSSNVRRVCIDATGLGMQFAEGAVQSFGESRVEAIHFTQPIKEELGGLMRRVFDQRAIEIPDHRQLIDDLHSVRKVTTIAGNVRLQAPRKEGSHADRYTALSLALHATPRQSGPQSYEHRVIPGGFGFARVGTW